MASTLSNDLRERVVGAVEAGGSRRGAAARFGVSVATVIRWARTWRETGETHAKPRGGDRRSGRIEAFGEVLMAAVEHKPDITLMELQALLREHGASFGIGT